MKFWSLLFAFVFMNIASAQVPQSNHVWIITEENHSFEEVIGNPSMPYFNALAAKYGLATQYYSNRHNSLAALMWLVAGQTVTTDDNASGCFNVDNVVREVLARGLTWKSYQVDLPYPGFQGLSNLNYVRRHNPLIDFTDSCAAAQQLNSVPFTQLATDIARNATPNFSYISPNLKEDAHDGTLPQADQWLAAQLPAILARPEFQPGGDGLLFVVWDEGDLSNDNRCSARLPSGCGGRLATLVIGPQVKPGYQSTVRYDHANLLRTVCDAMSFASCPGEGAVASPMLDFFNTVQVSTPFANSAVASPLQVRAVADNESLVSAMQIYVDGALRYQTSGAIANASLPLSQGGHQVVVQSWDAIGGIHKRGVNVLAQSEAVVVKSPAPNAAVSSPVLISANGNGSSPVYAMQVYVDDALQYQVSGSAINAKLPMSKGQHHVVVQAWDDSGGTTKSGFNLTVVPTPSVMTISPMGNLSVYSPLEVTAITQDSNPVYAMQVYVDNALQYEFRGTGLATPLSVGPGSHHFVVQAWDTAGGVYKNGTTIKVKPVIVTIVAPASSAILTSPVTIKASVQADAPVYAMQIYVDSNLAYQANGSTLNEALPLSSGQHNIVVQAWDNGGGTWKSNVSVTVK
jgi:acid phosphatase